jgi:hypothetical protein
VELHTFSVAARCARSGMFVAELRRSFEVARAQSFGYSRGLPTRANPMGDVPDDVMAILRAPTHERPGAPREQVE